MNTTANASIGMNYRYQSKDPSRKVKGLVVVIALHAFLGYALVSGLARKGLDIIKKPLEAVVIQEVIIPPPPPPPPPKKIEPPKEAPKVEAPPPPFVPPPDEPAPVETTAPVIVAAVTPPPAPVVIAPPPPPAPPTKVVGKSRAAGNCTNMIPPEMPRKATQEGISGEVRAKILVVGGLVKEVTIVSGPRVFHSAVREVMRNYKCAVDDGSELTQEFAFKLAD